MTGYGHAAVGGLIGKFLPLPIALPLELASHFTQDVLPHYGIPYKQRAKSKFWKYFSTLDFIAAWGLAVFAIATHHYAVLAGGFVAATPGFAWIIRVIRTRSFNLGTHNHWFTKWHVGI